MTNQNLKITSILCVVWLLLSASSASTEPPCADDINNLSGKARQTANAFMADSFEMRMKYEYSGKFLKREDKENLRRIAKKAGHDLVAIAKEQKYLKQQIEDYQGDDWDRRYGSTGLWRKLSADVYKTVLYKCQIDFYLALTYKQPQKDTILHNILTEIDSLNLPRLPAKSQLLKAKTLAMLSRTDPTYEPPAKKEFDEMMERSDMAHSTVFTIAMERIKLLGEPQPGRLEQMAKNIAQSSCADDLELILPLVFLQRRYDFEGFEETIKLFPETEDFIGSLILDDISSNTPALSEAEGTQLQISVFEAELAVQAVWKDKAQNHKALLASLADEDRFQTPLILYVTAVSLADSSPAKAVELLIESGRLQQLQKSDRLDIEANEIAGQAAQLAYNLFVADTQAKLELIAQTIRQKQYENPQHKIRLASQFSDLVTDYNDCQYADEAMVLLGEIIEQIDTYQKETEQFSVIIQACKKLALFCYDCLDARQRYRAGLYLAEVSVFAADGDKEKLSEVERLLGSLAENGNDVDLVRCRARLLIDQREFEEAGRLWSQICQVRKNEPASPGRRSWKWWRAKYYQLYCWANCAGTQKKGVLHTIEVLESSFEQIPPLWCGKLEHLKRQ